jgi:zinc D-Ala-D-Ala dipeptidase
MGKTTDLKDDTMCGRVVPCAVVLLLLLCGMGIAQPVSDIRAAKDMVEVVRLDSSIHLDIRYATPNNFMGRPMYTQARAFLQRPAAEALVRAVKAFRQKGYGILLFDGYRPWAVTKKFWDETPPAKRQFVANPSKGSKHNRGCAVDVSLYDLATGREVEMPSSYDEFSERAASRYSGGTESQRAKRDMLRSTMVSAGFTIEPSEWWHFDYREWSQFPILDVSFESLSARRN